MYKIVLTAFSWASNDVERQHLPPDAEIVETEAMDEEGLIKACADADAVLSEYAPLTRRVLTQLENCKIVASTGIGVDHIDLAAARELGIAVTNVPGYCAYEVAEHTIALMLASLRNIVRYDRDVRRGSWDINSAPPMTRDAGRKLGLLGLGNIPRKVAKRARALEMTVVANDPYLPIETARELGIPLVSLEEIWETCDVISCHLPMTSATASSINAEVFGKMQRSPLFINTSRGGVVNQRDLAAALCSGQLSAAALDVLAEEPPGTGEELLRMENVIITPHAGFYSREALLEVRSRCAGNVRDFLEGAYEKVDFVVRPAGCVG